MEVLDKETLPYCHFVYHNRHTDYSAIKARPQQLQHGDQPPELWHDK